MSTAAAPAVAMLLVAAALPGLTAQERWGVVAPPDLDPRLSAELTRLAGESGAKLVPLAKAREDRAQRITTLIELVQAKGGVELFAKELRRSTGGVANRTTPQLLEQGYAAQLTYIGRSSRPRSVRLTAATAEGFHNALARLPDFLHVWPASLKTTLVPRVKSLRVEKGGKRVVVADFPSFPIRGIVEGFYGEPWSHQERLDMMRFEGRHAMNAYYYAPKDDPYHRKLWAEPYPPDRMKQLGELAEAARANFVDFCFAISPGLSMTYSSDDDFSKLTAKLDSVAKLGVNCYALFLDDVPQDLQNPPDQARFKTLADAHVYVINKLDGYLKAQSPKNHLTVTPTTYTNAWGSRDYIKELGASVNPDVDLVWTGTKVVSPTITVADAREWGGYLRRPPLIWDNFPVNDGIRWRLNLGPLPGRAAGLPAVTRGLLSNPMNQAYASMIPLQTIAAYLWNSDDYVPDRAEQKALLDQYGKDAAKLLGPYLRTYSDYWWQDNLFKPLFVETRKPIDLRSIRTRIAALDSSLAPLRQQSRFSKLAPELSRFPESMRQRRARVEADPAFRQRADGRLVWREDYDVLEAHRLTSSPTLDGDFTKWQSGPLYRLDTGAQLRGGSKVWKGPDQFSARVALAWDAQYFYVGVDVTNPDLYQPFTGRDISKGDTFRLTLDAAFRKDFAAASAGVDDYLLLFSPGDFSGVAPSIYSEEDYLPPRPYPRDYEKEIKTTWKKTATGFSGDIAIPVTYFDGGKFHPGYEIGLDIGVRKVIPPPAGTPPAETAEATQSISFDSKAGALFPAVFGNPASYQRLVLRDQ